MQLRLPFDDSELRFCVLGSGSSGNCVVVDTGDGRILVDAGFSCREIEKRLDAVGIEDRAFDAVVLTHEHGDHVRGAARFSKRHSVPIYATRGTLSKVRLQEPAPRPFVLEAGRHVELKGLRLEPFAIPHDAREPIGMVVEFRGQRLGIVGDLGERTRDWRRLRDLDALVLETNHDLEMLRSGPYPWHLKKRIAGARGHLSNQDAAQALQQILSDRLRWVVLYHLSTTNNLPMLAEESIAQVVARAGLAAEIRVSRQHEPTAWFPVGSQTAA